MNYTQKQQIQYNTIQYNTVQYNTIQYNTMIHEMKPVYKSLFTFVVIV